MRLAAKCVLKHAWCRCAGLQPGNGQVSGSRSGSGVICFPRHRPHCFLGLQDGTSTELNSASGSLFGRDQSPPERHIQNASRSPGRRGLLPPRHGASTISGESSPWAVRASTRSVPPSASVRRRADNWEQIGTPLVRCHPDRLTRKSRNTIFVRMPRGCSSDQPGVMVGLSGWSAFSGVFICF